MKDNVAKVIYRLLLVITVIVTAIIVGFTIVQMGVFFTRTESRSNGQVYR